MPTLYRKTHSLVWRASQVNLTSTKFFLFLSLMSLTIQTMVKRLFPVSSDVSSLFHLLRTDANSIHLLLLHILNVGMAQSERDFSC